MIEALKRREMDVFADVGKTIKTIAVVAFALLCIAAFVTGIVLMSEGLVGYGLLTWVVGPLVAFVSSCLIYGFGEVVDTAIVLRFRDEQNASLSGATAKAAGLGKKRPYTDIVRCEKQPAGLCAGCKQMRAELWQCIVKTGTQYKEKKMCQRCIDTFVVR